jgi:hypothetical protein
MPIRLLVHKEDEPVDAQKVALTEKCDVVMNGLCGSLRGSYEHIPQRVARALL